MIAPARLLGYLDEWTLRPGEVLTAHVSSPVTLSAELVRIVCGDDRDDGAPLDIRSVKTIDVDQPSPGERVVPCGSMVSIPTGEALRGLAEFNLAIDVMTTRPCGDDLQLIVAWEGLRIGISADGRLVADIAGATAGASEELVARRWYRLTIVRHHSGALTVAAGPIGRGRRAEPSTIHHQGPAPSIGPTLELAGRMTPDGVPVSTFDGRLDRVRLWDGSLPDEVDLEAARPLCHWDFSIDPAGSTAHDTGPLGLHGTIVNAPTRAVRGSRWDGSSHDWTVRPEHYSAIHFHADDLDDCRWPVLFSTELPADLDSGVYAVRLTPAVTTAATGFADEECYLPFFVLPAVDADARPIAFLASTYTYQAYGNQRIHFENLVCEVSEASSVPILDRHDITLMCRADLGPSLYDSHLDGSPCQVTSRRRPFVNLAPRTAIWAFNADTHITAWMDARAVEADVITDEALHHEGIDLLRRHRVIVTGSHPEYWTTAMWDALEAWLSEGGRLIYLGGNGFYWRTAVDERRPWIIEVRRAETGARYVEAVPSEYVQQFDGRLGGLWRRLGRTPQELVGVGMVADGWDRSSPYRTTDAADDPRVAFLFPDGRPEVIGDHGSIGGGAAGSELDAADPELGTPDHALVIATSERHSAAYVLAPEETIFIHPGVNGDVNERVHADLVFFETPGGGAVLSTGSIAWSAALVTDGFSNDISELTERAVRRFADPEPFAMPPDAAPSPT